MRLVSIRSLVISLVLLCIPASCLAADAVSRTITVDQTVSQGQLMSLDGSKGTPANLKTANQLVGVVSPTGLINIGDSNQAQSVAVTTSGPADALVSDLNGRVKKGDRVTASPISGVGMKATETGRVIGVALTDFNPAQAKSQIISDKDGRNRTVMITEISLQVGPTDYTVDASDTSNIVPVSLQNSLNTVAGREVSAFRTIASIVVIAIGFFVAAIMIGASIRATITAIGRNPLAARSVRKELYQVVLAGMVVIGASMLSAYLLIRV